jgi:hypothetical protein
MILENIFAQIRLQEMAYFVHNSADFYKSWITTSVLKIGKNCRKI